MCLCVRLPIQPLHCWKAAQCSHLSKMVEIKGNNEVREDKCCSTYTCNYVYRSIQTFFDADILSAQIIQSFIIIQRLCDLPNESRCRKGMVVVNVVMCLLQLVLCVHQYGMQLNISTQPSTLTCSLHCNWIVVLSWTCYEILFCGYLSRWGWW